MAIDTADKRSSALLLALPWRGRLPAPDAAAETQADRQHVGLMYSGILASGAAQAPAKRRLLTLLGVGG